MDKDSVLQTLGQVSAQEVGEIFREYLRGATTREMLIGVMTEEVTGLCGAAYHPREDRECYRAGSATGYAHVESRREDIVRPRVRRQVGDDTTEEVTLESYAAAQDASEAQRLLLESLVGRSTRQGRECSTEPAWEQQVECVSVVTKCRAREVCAAERSSSGH